MDNKIRGKYGEDLAVSYLEGKGFEILERNYRYGRSEIDLIVLLENTLLVFVEVKMRNSTLFGEPETFVGDNQQKRIIAAAEEYIHGINWKNDIRFDIIAIYEEQITHLEDAFY